MPHFGAGGGKDGKEAEQHAKAVASYIQALQKAQYEQHNLGKTAEVEWDRAHGALQYATQAQYQHALYLAKSISAYEPLKKQIEDTKKAVADYQKQIALGDSPNEAAKVAYEQQGSALAKLAAAGNKHAQSLLAQQAALARQIDLHKQSAEAAKAFADIQEKLNDQVAESARKLQETTDPKAAGFGNFLAGMKDSLKGLNLTQMIGAVQAAGRAFAQIWNNDQKVKVFNDDLKATEEATKRMAEAAKAWSAFQEDVDHHIEESRGKIQDLTNPQAAGFTRFVEQFRSKLQGLDLWNQVAALVKLKSAFETISANDAQYEQTKGFNAYLAEMQKRLGEINAGSDLERFANQFKKINEAGQLIQPYSAEQLRQMKQQFDVVTQAEQQKQKVQEIATSMKGIFNNAFEDLFQHGFKGFYKNVIGGFGQMLQQMAAQYLSSQLSSLILGGVTGIAGAIGGGGGGLSWNNSSTDFLLSGARAGGGDILPNRAYLVGERGPEIVSTRSAGTVIPNHALGSALGGDGESGHTFHFYFQSAPDPSSAQRTGMQVGLEAARTLERARMRNGGSR
jgi:hypothetical protein